LALLSISLLFLQLDGKSRRAAQMPKRERGGGEDTGCRGLCRAEAEIELGERKKIIPADVTCWNILTINVPVVYMVRYKVVLRGDYP
jgi:hypothetical protein